jgi:hypothetical protein
MFHVQPHRHIGKFDDGETHGITGTPELVSPSRLECAGEGTYAVQLNCVKAVAIFDPQSAISSRATQ